ncbi:MAG: hypothetical protein C4539_16165, partial [Ignavibacteriales bacterium]
LIAQIPQQINYQGMLTDAGGTPLTGTYTINFNLYNDATGSSALWTETQSVTVSHGLFSVQLGFVNPVPFYIFDGTIKYLGVQVGTDPEMTPRQKLTSVGYSFKSADAVTLNGLPSSSFSLSDHNHNSIYPLKTDLQGNDGTVNQTEDPISWTKIKDIPADFADGTDDVGSSTSGITQINGGNGITVTNPTGPTATVELNTNANDGAPNETDDPVNWTKLKDVPAGFADGVDNGIVDITVGGGLSISSQTGPNVAINLPLKNDLATNDGTINQTDDLVSWNKLKDVPGGFADGTDDGGSTVHNHYGESWSNTNSTYGLNVQNAGSGNGLEGASVSNTGVLGTSTGIGGNAIGVKGVSPNGYGLYGEGGTGIYASGNAAGVYAVSNNGYGVMGTSGTSNGVYGSSVSSAGVFGESTNGYGVRGNGSIGINGTGTLVGTYGYSSEGVGAQGQSVSGTGVAGQSESGKGVSGFSTSTTGVEGSSGGSGESGKGVYGIARDGYGIWGEGYYGAKTTGTYTGLWSIGGSSSTETNYGVYAQAGYYGVYGLSQYCGICGVASNTGYTYGVYGGGPGYGVYGSSANVGVAGMGEYGVCGYANSTSAYSIYGMNRGGNAGGFDGNVTVWGTVSKSAGAFKIDHPLDPENKYLQHSFVESPDMKNIYDGTVILNASGEAIIELPDWFEALNKDFRYQLTCIGGYAQVYIAEKISNNRFKISGGTSGLEISWQVTGIRKDAYAVAHPIEVEVDKPTTERGKYIFPELFGAARELGINYEQTKRSEEMQKAKDLNMMPVAK